MGKSCALVPVWWVCGSTCFLLTKLSQLVGLLRHPSNSCPQLQSGSNCNSKPYQELLYVYYMSMPIAVNLLRTYCMRLLFAWIIWPPSPGTENASRHAPRHRDGTWSIGAATNTHAGKDDPTSGLRQHNCCCFIPKPLPDTARFARAIGEG